ncbi:MAG: glycosyltransferase family 1 protein [Candidatus Paceibacterota bacterium]|jgi:glycosyltransferase involved in cell wall biosynthesis
MNILIDVRLLSKGRISGIEEYTKSLIHSLLKEGSKDTFHFFYNGFRKAPFPTEWKTAPNAHLIEWNIPNKLLDLTTRFLGWPRVEQIAHVDLVFSPHFNLLPATKHTKRVITFHDLSFLHFPEFYPLRKRLWHWQQDYRTQAMRADALIAVSEFTRQDLISTFHLPEEKVHTVYSGINPFFSELPEESPERARFAKEKNLQQPFLLFTGVLEPRKNVSGIIRAFNEIKKNPYHRELQLVIVGRKGWLYDTIFRDAAMSPWSRDIRFWGEASLEDLNLLYNLASVFVYPSFFEGFGFPPLEAQACGLPVITSNRSSLPEIVGESALLVDPWKTDELITSIDLVLRDTTLANDLKKRGRINSTRFSWQQTATQLLELFHSLI